MSLSAMVDHDVTPLMIHSMGGGVADGVFMTNGGGEAKNVDFF